MSLRLKHIDIRNWLTIKDQHVDFPDQGLIIVNGVNQASNGKMSSVGSGKTALGEAINRAVLGLDGRYAQLPYYARHDKGNMYVKLGAEKDGIGINIELGYKCNELSKNSSALRYTVNGLAVERDRVEHTRNELNILFGINPELSRWTVCLDGGMLQFSDLSQRNAVDLLMQAMDQPSWDDLYVKARQVVAQDASSLQQCDGELQQITADIDTIKKRVSDAKASLANEKANEEKARLNQDSLVSTLEADLNLLLTKRADCDLRYSVEQDRLSKIVEINNRKQDEYRSAVAEFDKELDLCNKEVQGFVEQRGELAAKISLATRQIADLTHQPEKTPLNSAMQRLNTANDLLKTVDDDISQVLKARDQIESILDDYWNKPVDNSVEIVKIRSDIDGLESALAQIREKIGLIQARKTNAITRKNEVKPVQVTYDDAVLRGIQRERNDIQRNYERVSQDLNRAKAPIKSGVDGWKILINERQNQLELADEKRAKTEEKYKRLAKSLSIARYWETGFSPSGIPNMVLSSSIDALNDVSRRISTLMTGGIITVNYNTVKNQHNGAKPVLNINVDNKYGATRVQGNSKGESGLTNLIIAETLAEVGRVDQRVGYRWYDEITNGQDSQVRSSIFAYLKDLAARKRMLIFLVDHSPEAANYADHTLVAAKTDQDGGTTEFHWES